jgi:dephospho-CoA kinase
MRQVIGLTGGIATGKSTVARMFIDEGIYVIDSDRIAKAVQEQKTVQQQIATAFGTESIQDDHLNRVYLAQLIFSDKEKRQQLNDIIHPIVKQEITNLLARRKNELVIVDVPLMYETDFYKMMDKIIVVYATAEQQIHRLMLRNHLTHDEALERINAQMPIEEKVKKADYVLDNTKSKHELFLQFKELKKVLLQEMRRADEVNK